MANFGKSQAPTVAPRLRRGVPPRPATQAEARAIEAVRVFRSMLPTLNSYARAVTGNPKVTIEITHDNGSSNRNTIFFAPPIKLGDKTPHQLQHCHKRNSDGMQTCPACRIREHVMAVMYHEIGHISQGTFDTFGQSDIDHLMQAAIPTWGRSVLYYRDQAARTIRDLINRTDGKGDDFMNLCRAAHDWLPKIFNAVEDARVNERIFSIRPGVRAMYEAMMSEIRNEGVPKPGTDERTFWKDASDEFQIVLAVYARLAGYDISDWFRWNIVTAMQDVELNEIFDEFSTTQTARDSFQQSFTILNRLNELGFLRLPDREDPVENPKVPPASLNKDPEPEPESEEEPQPQEESKDGKPSDTKPGESDDTGATDDDGETEESGDETDSPEDENDDSSDGEESTGDSEAGDSESGSGADDVSEVGEPGDSDLPEAEEEGEPESDGDSSEDSQGQGGQQGDSPDHGEHDPESLGDEVDGGDTDELRPEGEESTDSEGTSVDEEDDSGGEDPEGIELDPGEESDTGDRDDGSGDDSSGRDAMEESEPGYQSGELGDPIEDQEADGDSETESPVPDGDGDDVGETVDTGAATEPIEVDITRDPNPSRDFSRPDEVNVELGEQLDPDDRSAAEVAEELDALKGAVLQGAWFDQPARGVEGVNYYREGDADFACGLDLYAIRRGESDVEVTEDHLRVSRLQMRLIFEANRRASMQRHMKAGKINATVLGKRAPLKDPRLFQVKRIPGKIDYYVVIGMDLSGSTQGVNLKIEKNAIYAQAELLTSLAIPFSIFGHSGFLGDSYMDIYEIKSPHDKWDDKVKYRLMNMRAVSANLDGHALEFLRKRADESNATHKIILYYSDGKMPAANGPEEKEVLVREIGYCARSGHTLLGVGIRTDSPKQYGLDTVQLDELEDLPKVITQLGKYLAKVNAK